MGMLAMMGFEAVAVQSDHPLTELNGSGWQSAVGNNLRISNSSPPFSGAQYLETAASGRGVYWQFSAASTMYMGARVRLQSVASAQLLQLRDDATTQVDVRTDSSGHLICTRNGTQIGSAGATVLAVNTWYYVEFSATINASTGSFAIKLNGVSEVSGSGLNTKNTANATANRAYFTGAADMGFDDLYVSDSGFAGPIRIVGLAPNGNGNSSALVGSDGNSTDNYLLIDEKIASNFSNADTDYVESDVVGNKDTYALANLPTVPTAVLGVTVHIVAKATDAGARSIAPVLRSGGADYDGTSQTLASSYLDYSEIFTTDPATSAAWTESAINGLEVGMKVAA